MRNQWSVRTGDGSSASETWLPYASQDDVRLPGCDDRFGLDLERDGVRHVEGAGRDDERRCIRKGRLSRRVGLDAARAGHRWIRGQGHRDGRDGQIRAAKDIADLQANRGRRERDLDRLTNRRVPEDKSRFVLHVELALLLAGLRLTPGPCPRHVQTFHLWYTYIARLSAAEKAANLAAKLSA
ncbi:hypothetical protein HYQ44_011659 [Verticillium longisporum]|nr:hypothetical protein HYQ44_011659 [Verticillium longisporum]